MSPAPSRKLLSAWLGPERAQSFLQPDNTVRDTDVYDGWTAGPSLAWERHYQDRLREFYRPQHGLGLTEMLVEQIEEAISNDPLVSNCYEKLISFADTDFEIKLETRSETASEAYLQMVSEQIPRLFPCCLNLRDAKRFIYSRLIMYGVFSCQLVPTEDLSTLQKIIIPPPESILWKRQDDEWVLVQKLRGNEVPINPHTFIYQPLCIILNKQGGWVVPPLKPAIQALGACELFNESLGQIARRTGMQKILDANFKISDKNQHDPSTEQFRGTQKKLQRQMQAVAQQIQQTLPNGVIFHPDLVELKELSTVEPSEHLSTFRDLLYNQVVVGAKLYPALVGVLSGENQTTLSTNQKKAFKSFITTSIQKAGDSALQQIIKNHLILNGALVENLQIVTEEPQMDSNLEEAQARKADLEAEMLARQLEAQEESVSVNDDGSTEEDGEPQKEPVENE